MKLVLLAPELFASEGGIARILRLYLKACCETSAPGDEVRLVVLNDAQFDTLDARRYSDERLSDWAMCARRKPAFVRAALRAARSADLLICGHIAQLPVAWLCRRLNPSLRYVLVAHGLEVWRRFSLAERLALRRAHQVWCVSEHTRQQLLAHSAVDPGRAVVLPNALDPVLQPAEAPAPATGSVLLTLSRLTFADRYKGVDHLIEVLPEVRRAVPDATLHVVGRGDDLARLQTLAAQVGVGEQVRFLGYVGDRDLAAAFSGCRAFALPSEREGFGLVYVEAMAHGRACVGALAGGTPEVITPEVGLLAAYGDRAELARCCVEALRRTWDVGALQARAAHFSYANFRDRLGALLRPAP